MVAGINRLPTYRTEMQELLQALLEMGGLAEEALAMTTRSLFDGEVVRKEQAQTLDAEINRLEKMIDERCHKVLALHNPAASDLRFVTQALRFTGELERVGDLAANIVCRAEQLRRDGRQRNWAGLSDLSAKVKLVLSGALDSFVNRDAELAREVLRLDDAVDQHYQRMYRELEEALACGQISAPSGLALVLIIKDFERLADHATNIAEGVIFFVLGRDVRHFGEN